MEDRLSTQRAARDAVNAAFDAQPKWYKSKSTLINLLQGVVWLVGVVTPLLTSAPEWVALLIGGVGTLAAAGLSKLTPGEFTPSMAGRVAQFAPDIVTVAETSGGNDTPPEPENYPVPSFPAVVPPEDDYAPRHARTPHDSANLAGNGSTVVGVTPVDDETAPDYGAYMKTRREV